MLEILQPDRGAHFSPRRNVLGKDQIELETGEAQAADESRDQPGGEHRGQDQEEKIIRGGKRTGGDDAKRARINEPGTCDALAQSFRPGVFELRPPLAKGLHCFRLASGGCLETGADAAGSAIVELWKNLGLTSLCPLKSRSK